MFKKLRGPSSSILAQITAPYVILAIAIAAGGFFIISQILVGSVEDRFTNQLLDTGRLVLDGMVTEEQDLLESLRLVSFTQGVDQALEEGQASALRSLVLPVAYNARAEVIALVGIRGQALISHRLAEGAQSYQPWSPDTPLGLQSFVQNVLDGITDEQGDKFSAIVSSPDGDFLLIAGPVTNDAGVPVGAAVIGKSLVALSRDLRETTLGHVTFYSLQGAVLATTLQQSVDLEASQVSDILQQQDTGTFVRPIDAEGLSYFELLLPMQIRQGDVVGITGISLATQFLEQANRITRTNVLALLGVALLLVLVVGAFVARRITRPIQDLRDAAIEVSAGNLSVKVKHIGNDEVGVLAQSFNEMVDNLNRSKQELLDTYDKTIEGWSTALDLRDSATEGHSRRVAEMAVKLGKRLGLSQDELERLYRGSLLHDIGKIAVPDNILNKKGKLTKSEVKIMQLHPQFGQQFMSQIEFLKPSMDVPYSHHEKWDGTGYPQGLKGEAIPYLARIFAVADVWDAITSDRPYRKAMSYAEAVATLREGRGTHFDPRILQAFLNMLIEEHQE